MNNIVISASTECQCSKKRVIRVKVFGYRGIVAWKTYFEKFDGNFQWGTRGWWEYLKTIMQKKLPLENSFHEKLFWRTLLSVGVQKPEDRKKTNSRTFSNKESLWKMEFFFEPFGNKYQRGTQENQKYLKDFFSEKLVFLKNVFHEQFFWTKDLSVRVQTFDDRKEKLYFGEKTFFLDVCSPQKKLIVLVCFINGVHRIDVINKNRSLEKLFF